MTPSCFVVDTMLGRLARWLRAMGYDTLYPGQAEDRRLLQLSRLEGRILITRDRRLARLAEPLGCLISSELVDDQVRETVDQLALSPDETGWLSRCLNCNTPLSPRPKEEVQGWVPDHIFATQVEFMGCPGCGRIYWSGSHAERIRVRLRLLSPAPRPRAT